MNTKKLIEERLKIFINGYLFNILLIGVGIYNIIQKYWPNKIIGLVAVLLGLYGIFYKIKIEKGLKNKPTIR